MVQHKAKHPTQSTHQNNEVKIESSSSAIAVVVVVVVVVMANVVTGDQCLLTEVHKGGLLAIATTCVVQVVVVDIVIDVFVVVVVVVVVITPGNEAHWNVVNGRNWPLLHVRFLVGR